MTICSQYAYSPNNFPEPQTDNRQTQQWLEMVRSYIASAQQQDKNKLFISWSAFFASLQQCVPKPLAITSLLPLFRQAAHTLAMVKHGIDIIKNVTVALNPEQMPILTVDQPLYAIAKQIQWKWSGIYGQNEYLIMMGGLHIEIAVLKVLVDWLKKSGWTYLISAANVTTEERAESLLNGTHVSRCQWAHQVTAAALYNLLCMSYEEYKDETPDEEHFDFDRWCSYRVSNSPQCSYWYKTFQLQLLFL